VLSSLEFLGSWNSDLLSRFRYKNGEYEIHVIIVRQEEVIVRQEEVLDDGPSLADIHIKPEPNDQEGIR
jgi:hypothetical protein